MVSLLCGLTINFYAQTKIDTTVSFKGVQKGDLIFTAIPLDYDIKEDSSKTVFTDEKNLNFIHVSIADVENDSVWIIDATLKRGVARYPLDTFLTDFTLKDGAHPVFFIMRLKKNKNVETYVENAKKFIGRAYDLDFNSSNDEKYCSELVRDSYVKPNGKKIFKQGPISFKNSDGTTPQYWISLFQWFKRPIPEGIMGTLPNSMIHENCIKKVNKK